MLRCQVRCKRCALSRLSAHWWKHCFEKRQHLFPHSSVSSITGWRTFHAMGYSR
ncbi:hypothetical protein BJV74DRAFT_864100 [Russula compacta]|nr:hypothetical protein BJV74DRAFT_864100 [Russula compacta]